MAKTHPLFHKFKAIVGYSIAIVVIIVALTVSGVRLLLTTANLYQEEVEQLASTLLEQPVKIGRMDAKLSGLIPTIIFHHVDLLSEQKNKPLFSLTRIDVGLSLDDLIWQQKVTPQELTIRGLNLHVTRSVDGSLKIKGLDLDALKKSAKNESDSILERWLLHQGEIGIEDSTFIWKDEQNAGLTWFFYDVNFLIKSIGKRHQLLLSSKLPEEFGSKLKMAVDIAGDISTPETWDAKVYLESKKINLQPAQTYFKNTKFELLDGFANLNLWLDWKNKNINKLSGDVKLYNFSYRTGKNKTVSLNFVSGVFDVLRDNDLWTVGVNKFNYGNRDIVDESQISLAFKYSGNSFESFYVDADYLRLDEVAKVVTDNHLLQMQNEKYLEKLNVQGELQKFSMKWDTNRLHQLKAAFKNVGLSAWNKMPEIKGLSGKINYDKNKGYVSLSSATSIVGFPNLFRDAFKLKDLSADIVFSNTPQGMLFEVDELITKNVEVSAVTSGKLWLPKNKKSPYLDFQTHVSEGDVSKTSHYLPVSIMNKSLVKWLDAGLVSGKVDKGTIIFNGKLKDFPFNNKEGIFLVDVATSNVTLNYQNGWPKITKSKAALNFTGQGMNINVVSSESGNNVMRNSSAVIKSFRKPQLELGISATGSAHNAVDYLVNTPILHQAKNTIDSMRLSGNVDANINVSIPLNDKLRKTTPLAYSGAVKLYDTSLTMLEDKLDITNGNGNITFTNKMISSENLTANILGEKASLSISSDDKNIKIGAKGKMKPGLILKRFDIPVAKQVSGSTLYTADLNFPLKKNKSPVFNLYSNLSGIQSLLPDQFYKQEKTSQPFKFFALFKGKNKFQLGLDFEKRSSAVFELLQTKKQTYLNKGSISVSEKKATLPEKNILYIDGAINKVTPSKWQQALEWDDNKKSSKFFRKPVVINLDKLTIFTVDDESSRRKTVAANPKNVPSFQGVIKNLYLNKMLLGRLDFSTSATKYGLHFDEVILSEKNMKLLSNGEWRYKNGKHTTNMDLTLSSDDFGNMLTGLGYAAVIEKGKAKTVGQASWNGAPTEFSFKNLNGIFQLNITDGNIVEAEAGAGRLLGLFSLSALPRKLFGDFTDTFKSGFNFDSAKGEVRINEGDAYTTGFIIKSPVAKVIVSGRTGLATRDYENTIEVVPEVGGGLAGITALLVNLPAGVGLWLVDKITGEKINEASTRTYEVTGSWDKPIIEQIDSQ